MFQKKRKLIIPVNKEDFLKREAPFKVKFNEKRHCIHCGKLIEVKDYKVEQVYLEGEKCFLIVCPNAPSCDGTIIDWVSVDGGFRK